MITPTERKRLRELAEKASSAPWHIGHVSEIDDGSYEIDASNGELVCDNELPDNGLFIIAARTAVPQLLDLVEELEGIINRKEFRSGIEYQAKQEETIQALTEVLTIISKMRDGTEKNGPWTIANEALQKLPGEQ